MKSTECPEFYILFGTLGTNQENELGRCHEYYIFFVTFLHLRTRQTPIRAAKNRSAQPEIRLCAPV